MVLAHAQCNPEKSVADCFLSTQGRPEAGFKILGQEILKLEIGVAGDPSLNFFLEDLLILDDMFA